MRTLILLGFLSGLLGNPILAGEGAIATVDYGCINDGELIMTLTVPTGSSTTRKFNIDSYQRCVGQLSSLRKHRSRIDRQMNVAVCDGEANLHSLTVKPDGAIEESELSYVGHFHECDDQATWINSDLKRP